MKKKNNNRKLLLSNDERLVLTKIQKCKFAGIFVQGGNFEEYRIEGTQKFRSPDLWISCGQMIRISCHALDVEYKYEIFLISVSVDVEFSGEENNPIFQPKRMKVKEFPDDLCLDEFFLKGIKSIEPLTSTEIINTTKYQYHNKLNFINNDEKKLLVAASDIQPLALELSLR